VRRSPGVVDDQVQAAVAIDDGVDQRLHLVRIAHVARLEPDSRYGVLRCSPGTGDDCRTGVDQRLTHATTHTADAPRHERDRATEAQVHVC
jgi:hypothetical protein